ncbi:MAG: isocitrate lyase/PEP mutase family protein [Calditrichia bacterium]
MNFRELHFQEKPLLIGNVWDVGSAKAFEKAGFSALGTSSAAIAHSLGYEDGEQMSFDELLFIVKRIRAATTLPLSVDVEAGYAENSADIISNIERLYELGITGINIEDSLSDGKRTLLSIDHFVPTLKAISDYLKSGSIDMFLNVRTDAFLLGLPNALQESELRASAYREAGADGLFVPGITAESDIAAIVNSAQLPVNVMAMPNLPNFEILTELGVKRISMGNFPHAALFNSFDSILKTILSDNSFASIT